MPPRTDAAALEREASMETEDPTRAAALWRAAIDVEPTGERCFELGWLLYRDLADLDAALAAFEQGAMVDPTHAGCLGCIGDVLGEKGEHEAAIAAYDRALAVDPANCRALLNKAFELNGLRRHAEALPLLMIANEHHAREADVPYNIAVTHAWLGHIDKALDWLEKAARKAEHLRKRAREESAFEKLRGDSRFARIVGET